MDPGPAQPGQQQVPAVPAPPQLAASPPPSSTPTVATPATVAAQPAIPSPAEDVPPSRHAGTYVVQPGDSLWAIATSLLGPGASDARIAAEVARLWRHNAAAIATGDPDLLPVGTTLRLR